MYLYLLLLGMCSVSRLAYVYISDDLISQEKGRRLDGGGGVHPWIHLQYIKICFCDNQDSSPLPSAPQPQQLNHVA